MKRRISAVLLTLVLVVSILPLSVFALPAGVPETLPTPSIANLKLMKTEDGVPFFRAEVTIADSVLTLDNEKPTDGYTLLEIDGKYDDAEWGSTGGGGGHLDVFLGNPVPGKANTFYVDFDLEDEGGLTETVINSRTYSYKVQLAYTYNYGEGPGEFDYVYSAWSNVVSSKSGSYYEGSSSWAVAELDKALEYGLITDRIRDNMSGKVTREEFAEIAVRLYEKYTGKTASAGNISFTDTKNPEILKAANLGLVQGVGNNKYAPNNLISRQQMATILLRALKVINPAADFSTAGAAKFADDSKIVSYAREGAYYCAKAGIITGVGSNMFNPEGNATREMAVIVCKRAYEFYSK